MGRNTMTYQGRRLEPQHDLPSDRIRPVARIEGNFSIEPVELHRVSEETCRH
jgi:hypothetical protein